MRHPAARAVHLACRSRAGHRQVRHHRHQRVHRLGQVGRERRPVVHLGVDVDGVLAAPRRRHALVPDALQVGRLRTGARAGDQQVAAVLEVERGQPGIVAVGERPHTLVGRHALRRPEVECDAVEERLVIADVRGAQRVDALARRRIERRRDARGGIGADVLESPVAGRRGDEERDGVRIANDHGVAAGAAGSAGREHADAGLEAQGACHRTTVGGRAGAVAVDAAHHDVAVCAPPPSPAAASASGSRTRSGRDGWRSAARR